MKSLGWYLTKIDQTELISKRAFLKEWSRPNLNISFVSTVFTFGERDRDIVTIKEHKLFKQLKERYCSISSRNSRIEAAIGGNSHTVRVNGSLLMIRNKEHPYPVVIMIKQDKTTIPRQLKSQALIVENLQNFLLLEATLDFVKLHSGLDPDEIEVIWSNGNAINNALHYEFLNSFMNTWWLMDADLGGVQIMANALKYIPLQKFRVFIPLDFEWRLIHHGKELSDQEREDIMLIADKNTILQPFAKYLVRLHRQLEQETYLLTEWRNITDEF